MIVKNILSDSSYNARWIHIYCRVSLFTFVYTCH